jgi:hypothetical protein
MGAVLTIGVAEKAVGDKIRLPIDFGNEPLLIEGHSIVTFDVTAVGLSVSSKQLDYAYQVSAVIDGGVAGTEYDVVYTIVLDDPDASEFSRTGVLRVI